MLYGTEWNPNTVWIGKMTEIDGLVTIQGSAKNHEDVMTFLKRMKSSIYFEGIDLVEQKVGKGSLLGLPFVDFKLQAWANHNPNGYAPMDVKK